MSLASEIAASLAVAGKADGEAKRLRGELLDALPDGTLIRLGRKSYSKITVDGASYWTIVSDKYVPHGTYSSRDFAVELGTRLESALKAAGV